MSGRPCGCDPENLPKPYLCEEYPDCYFGREGVVVVVPPEIQIYPCGCSRLKVNAGRCDSYAPGGVPRV